MFKALYFLNFISLITSETNLAPGNVYDITWNKNQSSQVNLELELYINDTWVSHQKDDINYLSVILDGYLGKYDWDIPIELGKHWRHNSRITVSDTNTDDVILHRMVSFYGLSIDPVKYNNDNDTIYITWATNVEHNFTIILKDDDSEMELENNFNGLEFEYNMENISDGNYQIIIQYHLDLGEDEDILGSCVGGRLRRSCVGGRRSRRGCCLRLTGSTESNNFKVEKIVGNDVNITNTTLDLDTDDDGEETDKNFYEKCMDKKGCEIGFFVALVIVSLIFLYFCFYCFCSGYLGY